MQDLIVGAAYVLGDNRRMLGVLTRHTDVRERSVESGKWEKVSPFR